MVTFGLRLFFLSSRGKQVPTSLELSAECGPFLTPLPVGLRQSHTSVLSQSLIELIEKVKVRPRFLGENLI